MSDLAIAVIIGGAFGASIRSLVDDIFMTIIGALLGYVDFTGLGIQVGVALARSHPREGGGMGIMPTWCCSTS